MTEWRKSSRSATSDNTACVEVAKLACNIGIRDSKAPDAGHVSLPLASFADLISQIRSGELDL
ncbi:hypothetical protein Acsp03_56610 [Actinomadura sp. NBRC 104412]|uniref:DUF397 domain-containing protein n=1 Tax=Actinomadura sp. NBRC 104412 TaxID=3032203 RepID=UPI00249FDDC5|nr:DUF397 domain-containing protein [Actinomadura sp. NBRC 104412]GLZ08195.1 hypothetical protein Acsp03_56610 [Actinomadura sp. NBRC 104412]